MQHFVNYQDLFQQSSTQLNFLLLSQREMILVMAFALAILEFSNSLKNRFIIRLLILALLVYSLTMGVVSTSDYLDFTEKTKEELEREGFTDGLELLDNWKRWVNFTYALIAFNVIILIIFFFYELDYYRKKDHHHHTGESIGFAGIPFYSDTDAFKRSSSKSTKRSKKSS